MIELDDDKSRLDVTRVHSWLTSSYWSAGIDREQVERQIANSMCVDAYDSDRQIGFARAVTDHASFAWLNDVWVDESVRGKGVGRGLVRHFLNHTDLAGVRRFALVTMDAHGMYEGLGFHAPLRPNRWMEYLAPEFAARVRLSPT